MARLAGLIVVLLTFISLGEAQTTQTSAVQSPVSSAIVPTSSPCSRFASGRSLPAQLGYACLLTVPFKKDPALAAIENFKRVTQFHSTTGLLKNPTKGYNNPPVDLLALLDATTAKINAGGFANQLEFEQELANITIQAYDGHYSFRGNTFSGALKWRRGTISGVESASLVSVSADGKQLPKIYFTADVRRTGSNLGSTNSTSYVTQINGIEVMEFLRQEGLHQTFHDADARFNVLFARAAAESVGSFVSPWFYPGPNTTFTFNNGTERVIPNYAVVPSTVFWPDVSDGDSFYTRFVKPTSTTEGKTTTRDITKRSVPTGYPAPEIKHSDFDINLGGFFLKDPSYSDIAVLSINTFNYEDSSDGLQFQSMITKFLALCKAQNKKKLIIDVSSNGGGALFLGYDTFKQFFPSIEPEINSNMRTSEGLNILGSQFGTITSFQAKNTTTGCLTCLPAPAIYLQSIHYADSVDANLKKFSSWQDMAGPMSLRGEQFTKYLRYDFSSPYLGNPFTVTGYGTRAKAEQPFAAADIVLLHDGYCASTCAVFSDLMRRQGGVKTFVLGGRSQFGPMQPVGGTKGALLLPFTTLIRYVRTVLQDFGTTADRNEWAKILPTDFSIQASNSPSVNFRNAYHPGGDTPLQMLNETAHCRLFYTPAMVQNVTSIWGYVADTAWKGVDNCVAGGSTATTDEVTPASGVVIGSSATGKGGAMVSRGTWSWAALMLTGLAVVAITL